ncbi:zinc finger protein 488 [Microtus ochrogaster]|uniref:Zinc finger protein 488 n=1 Tax=Microtus ochrogaster TaxID=79684 RepID=A0ABM0KLD7_MICOH|nr:zinc finger protein 488 [Microtus ochrogaster]XP_026635746.1 zinc finger protein 488 [Microtus ochrogaster]XP_026635747.1 zinc finger protein 488 [Microtus ochrogaster]XP_026635748.1 zinc finger protein 488 [Microtus ochrogaster]XP_026635749.1 zinc finger protein 488 [Microtus ochrogaster]
MVTGTSTLLSLSGPSDHMAEEKAASLSPSVDKRWRLRGPKQIQAGLLKKASLLVSGAAAGKGGQDLAHSELSLSTALDKAGLDRPLGYKACTEQRQGSFTELSCLQESSGDMQALKRKPENPEGQLGTQQLPPDLPGASADGTECSVWPGVARSGKRSAFRRPASRPVEKPTCSPTFPDSGNAEGPWELSGLITTVDIPCWAQLSAFKLTGDFWRLHMLSQNILFCNAFHGAPTPWLDHSQVQASISSTPSATACRVLLPPTLSSPGLPTQNWCAKCNLAFRLTADLVLHMRSHHKREHGGSDPHSKKRREEVLTCPICHEYFRERHHLSRHMTSHS